MKVRTSGSMPLAPMSLAVATMLPMLLAFNFPPSPTVMGQCLAIGAWGAAVAALAARSRALPAVAWDVWPLHSSVALCALGGALAVYASAWPVSLALSTLLTLLAVGVVVQVAAVQLRDEEDATTGAAWFFLGLVVAGVLNAFIGIAQVWWPGALDGDWIARSSLPERAVGNLRQPNHLSSLLLWAVIAAVGLFEMRRLPGRWAVAIGTLLIAGVVLTGSRTGIVGVLLLAAWAGLDKRLSRLVRGALAATPIVFGIVWFWVTQWAHATGHAFGGEGRLALGEAADISSSRFAIWSNALSMIAREPLRGVGLGEFNLAWTLSEFPNRPTAFFDHTHNLPLQLAVELGLPIGSLVFGLLLVALCQAGHRAWRADGELGSAKRSAFMLVLMIGLHSLLEYPLWYAYFLLPAAFAWGFALSQQGPSPAPLSRARAPEAEAGAKRMLMYAGTAMALGASAAVLDYRSVVVIYEPPEFAAPLEERVVRGQHSVLYGHHADYAAATAFGTPKAPLPVAQQLAFQRAPHQLLDVRLMIAWAQALAAQGELDKARWLAARVREFRNPSSDEFFAPCKQQPAAAVFQCQPPQRVVRWREFVQ